MRRGFVALVLLVAALPPVAQAHKLVPIEHAILQIKPDSTEILYELLIPAGPAAARWRLLYDVDHDGRLSDEENQSLTQGLAREMIQRISLALEGNAIPLQIVDAKMTSTLADDGVSGRISAIIWLRAREIPPGKRKLEIELSPLTDSSLPALVRIETPQSSIDSISGAIIVKYEDGTQGVKLRKGDHCVIMLDVPPPSPSHG